MIAPLLLAAITVVGAWSRPAVDTGVVYATIRNTGSRPVALVGASTPRASSVELHESTTMSSGAMKMQGMTMPAMGMHPVSRIVIPAHGSVTLKPGGYHLMLLGLRGTLAAGQRIPLTLRFAGAPPVSTLVPVETRAF
ncbi:MAG TPA: copper chaperone PCu(A)C [Candidatus Sulfotelmatobacter sp.]|nr:copper chaperone PCu(A)C [Candidatus Sulfotelmatobacter sp.]